MGALVCVVAPSCSSFVAPFCPCCCSAPTRILSPLETRSANRAHAPHVSASAININTRTCRTRNRRALIRCPLFITYPSLARSKHFIRPHRLAQDKFGRAPRDFRRFSVPRAQTRDLQERLAGAREQTEQVALFGARLMDERRPRRALRPTRCRRRRRKVQLLHRLDLIMPFDA